jgi:hypothetical protein
MCKAKFTLFERHVYGILETITGSVTFRFSISRERFELYNFITALENDHIIIAGSIDRNRNQIICEGRMYAK